MAQVAAKAAIGNRGYSEAYAQEVCEARDGLVEFLTVRGTPAGAGGG